MQGKIVFEERMAIMDTVAETKEIAREANDARLKFSTRGHQGGCKAPDRRVIRARRLGTFTRKIVSCS